MQSNLIGADPKGHRNVWSQLFISIIENGEGESSIKPCETYLKYQQKSARKQRKLSKTVRMAQILREATRPSIGAKQEQGRISLHDDHSTALGQLVKSFQ